MNFRHHNTKTSKKVNFSAHLTLQQACHIYMQYLIDVLCHVLYFCRALQLSPRGPAVVLVIRYKLHVPEVKTWIKHKRKETRGKERRRSKKEIEQKNKTKPGERKGRERNEKEWNRRKMRQEKEREKKTSTVQRKETKRNWTKPRQNKTWKKKGGDEMKGKRKYCAHIFLPYASHQGPVIQVLGNVGNRMRYTGRQHEGQRPQVALLGYQNVLSHLVEGRDVLRVNPLLLHTWPEEGVPRLRMRASVRACVRACGGACVFVCARTTGRLHSARKRSKSMCVG